MAEHIENDLKKDKFALIEDLIAGVFLLGLAVVPVIEIFLRKISGSGLVWSSGFLQHVVIWVAWVGGIAASRENTHLSLSSGIPAEGQFWKGVDILKDVTATAINLAFMFASASFLVLGFLPGESIGIVPIRLILIILPIGYFSMSMRSLWRPGKKPSLWIIPGILAGLLLAMPSLANLLEQVWLEMPFGIWDAVDRWYMIFTWLRWPMVGLLIFLGIRGLPIYLMLGGSALLLFAGVWGAPETLPNEAYDMLKGTLIPTIPLFTVAGYFLSENSAGKRLVRFFRAAIGWLPGGLAFVAVVVCAYFTTFTGASGITILALGGLLATVLIDSGQYDKDFSQGLITSSGSVGLLFPMAIPVMMYGVTAQISIKDLYIGGAMPGLILVLVLVAMGVFRSFRNKAERVPFDLKEFGASIKGAIGIILLPIVLMTAYFSGFVNVVEMAAFAAVYTLVLTALYKELSWSFVVRVLRRSIPVIGGVLVILAMAKGLSAFIVDVQVPTMLTAFFRDHVSSKFVFLILLNIVLLITGTLMDIYSAILVVAPLIVPLGALYGIHPVQLGVIFLANLQLGYLTPPVGMNLFLASYTFNEPMSRIYRQVIPFLLVLLVAVLLITYVPWFSLAFIN